MVILKACKFVRQFPDHPALLIPLLFHAHRSDKGHTIQLPIATFLDST